jgi:type IV secretion system protein VirB8
VDSATDTYFEEASRWHLDRETRQAADARRAWWVAGGASLLTVLSTAALVTLMPLKRVEPYVIRVDNTTGIVDVVPAYAGTAELSEAVTRHLVTEYVLQRERYVPAIAEIDYEQVGAFHGAAMNQAWAAAWSRGNPGSPLNRYADGTQVRARITAISFLKHERGAPDVLQVRFALGTQRAAGAAEELAYYVSTLQVTYGPPSADVRLRALNPLGFKVLEYRREPESFEAETPAVSRTPSGGVP